MTREELAKKKGIKVEKNTQTPAEALIVTKSEEAIEANDKVQNPEQASQTTTAEQVETTETTNTEQTAEPAEASADVKKTEAPKKTNRSKKNKSKSVQEPQLSISDIEIAISKLPKEQKEQIRDNLQEPTDDPEELKKINEELHDLKGFYAFIGDKVYDIDEVVKSVSLYKEYQESKKAGGDPKFKRKELNLESKYTSIEDKYIRQTYYMSYEEVSAIEAISYEKRCKKSDLLRTLLDEALEAHYPGILEKVQERADNLREDIRQRAKKKEQRKGEPGILGLN